jgi:hypothetical protein
MTQRITHPIINIFHASRDTYEQLQHHNCTHAHKPSSGFGDKMSVIEKSIIAFKIIERSILIF